MKITRDGVKSEITIGSAMVPTLVNLGQYDLAADTLEKLMGGVKWLAKQSTSGQAVGPTNKPLHADQQAGG